MHPRTLKILGRKFKVTYHDRLFLDGSELMGLTVGTEQKIQISLGACDTEEQIRNTLLHEATHAALHVAGLTSFLSDELEEALVRCISHMVEEVVPQLSK